MGDIADKPELRDRERVYRDRAHAGAVLSEMLETYRDTDAVILAVPAGGVPVAAEMARTLDLSLDVVVVSKMTLPWNSEAGYGALAFDGTVKLNKYVVGYVGLTEDQIAEGIEKTKSKVARRVERFRGGRPFSVPAEGTVILVDDGLASGFTMKVAVEALINSGAGSVVVAVPTGHANSVREMAELVETVFCPNVRGGRRFAVASAYERWYDVSEEEALELLRGSRSE